MAEKPAAERTEQPTGKRLSKARGQGQVPYSQELPSVATLAALVAMLTLLAPSLMQWFIMQIRQGVSCMPGVFTNHSTFTNFINAKIIDSILVMCPIFAALSAASIMACIAVSGLNYTPGAVKFRWDIINPVAGLSKLIDANPGFSSTNAS